jgi:hypothetical protein
VSKLKIFSDVRPVTQLFRDKKNSSTKQLETLTFPSRQETLNPLIVPDHPLSSIEGGQELGMNLDLGGTEITNLRIK